MDVYKLEQIQYSVIRLGFINPVYLPLMKESFLRKDFNFAKYLGYCQGKTLVRFFNCNWITIFVVLVLVNLFRLSDVT